jgi:3',5'-cyclic AMP phosphodiesterase CpdA
MAADFVLAHLSDPHLGPLPMVLPRHWNAKRLFGFLNWHRRRRFIHRTEILERLVGDLAAQMPDHIAVTGDLTNVGLPEEHRAALAWLETLGPPDHVSVIPGNHDVYTQLHGGLGVGLWRPFMTSSGNEQELPLAELFPYERAFGQIVLIGVNSAIETPLGHATGRVDASQLSRLSELLRANGAAGRTRVVMIHHPPLVGQARPLRALTNAEAVERVLVEAGAELVLHGHNHVDSLVWRDGPQRPFPVVGIASSSYFGARRLDMRARYNLYRLSLNDGQVKIELTGRGIAEADGPVVELERQKLEP